MSDHSNPLSIRSEEVQEILTAIPNWMIRWGSTLVLFLILGVLAITWFIKYPDIISATAIITTPIPPQKEYAQVAGKIDTLLVTDRQYVVANQPLAIIENTADYRDVFLVKSILDTLSVQRTNFSFPMEDIPFLVLGDIATEFAIFENSYDQYLLNQQLEELQAQRSYQDRSLAISQTKESINNMVFLSQKTTINQTIEEKKLHRNVLQAFHQLKKAIRDWDLKYVLKSSKEGLVSFSDFWTAHQSVQPGDLVFTIISQSATEYIAKLKTPAHNSGKLAIGQEVLIKLDNYPATEFGTLAGRVKKIALLADQEGHYQVDVALPAKLVTSYQREIEFKQDMNGSAEIITEDLRLLERFFYQLKEVLNR